MRFQVNDVHIGVLRTDLLYSGTLRDLRHSV